MTQAARIIWTARLEQMGIASHGSTMYLPDGHLPRVTYGIVIPQEDGFPITIYDETLMPATLVRLAAGR